MILRKEQFWIKKRAKKKKDIQFYLISIKDYLTFKFEFWLPKKNNIWHQIMKLITKLADHYYLNLANGELLNILYILIHFTRAVRCKVISKRIFPEWQLPKCVISKVATSQVPPPQPVLTAELSPLAQLSSIAQPPLLPAVQPNLWEVSSWKIAHLGNCHFGSHSKENGLGKVPNTSS